MKYFFITLSLFWILSGKVIIFNYMKEKEWKAFIPFYSEYKIFEWLWKEQLIFVDIALLIGCFAIITAAAEMLFLGGRNMIFLSLYILGFGFIIAEILLLLVVLYEQADSKNKILSSTLGPFLYIPSHFIKK